ncbi:hypothetical protein [Halopiger djelfimassiliensis]|uniref:hypothetical protein n=1 Tax=Halopiger djelfimassiliensis TaxID=1293047 RepID=UPI000677B94A|nr:hypothetical protein [Halopiger djelfimassiliensis]
MSDDPESGEGESPTLPACPRCGQPVANVSVIGPIDAVAGPCGCRVAPGSVVSETDDGNDDEPDDGRDEPGVNDADRNWNGDESSLNGNRE